MLLVFIYHLFMPEIKTFYFVEYSGQGTELEIVPFDIKLTPAGGKFVASPSRRKAPGWRVLFTKEDLNRFADSEERAARQYLSQCLHKALIKENELRAAQNNVADAQGLVAKFEIKKNEPNTLVKPKSPGRSYRCQDSLNALHPPWIVSLMAIQTSGCRGWTRCSVRGE